MFQLAPHPELHSLFEALGYALAFAVYKRARHVSGDLLDDRQRWTVIAGATIGALLGSRMLGLLEQAPRIQISPWLLIMPSGGKTIVGGLLGGWLSVEITKRLIGVQTRTGDLFAIPLCIGIAVGRLGCLLAGLADDTYGKPTRLPWAVNFGDGVPRHPTQAYEILFLAALALALHCLKLRVPNNGLLFRAFLFAYLLWRVLIDFLKPEPLVAGMNLIQWACLAGLILLIAGARESFMVRNPCTRGQLA